MRSRISEIDQYAVAHVFGDKAIEAGDGFTHRAVISADDLAHILGIEPRGEPGRADEVAEHYRELPSLRTRRHRAVGCVRRAWYRRRSTVVVAGGHVAQCSDGGPQ